MVNKPHLIPSSLITPYCVIIFKAFISTQIVLRNGKFLFTEMCRHKTGVI